MGRPLIIKIYHKISDNINVDLKDLSNCLALPSQAIMDNIFYYGEAIILGNLPLEDKDYDMLISVSESISYINRDVAYLQYGLIYKEIPFSVYEKLIEKLKIETQTCRNECISFGIYADDLNVLKKSLILLIGEREIEHRVYDLRNPCLIELKRKIFEAFGLVQIKLTKKI